jgi:hypothetical protein
MTEKTRFRRILKETPASFYVAAVLLLVFLIVAPSGWWFTFGGGVRWLYGFPAPTFQIHGTLADGILDVYPLGVVGCMMAWGLASACAMWLGAWFRIRQSGWLRNWMGTFVLVAIILGTYVLLAGKHVVPWIRYGQSPPSYSSPGAGSESSKA